MKSTLALFTVALTVTATSCSSSGPKETVEVQESSTTDHSVASVVASSGRFEVLTSALVSAGMASELENDGPFTVFVVSDDSIEQSDLDGLATAGGFEALDQMAQFHVVPGVFTASELSEQSTVTTLTGQRLRLSNWNGKIELQSFGSESEGLASARVIEADLFCDNGIIHVIDAPLVPSFQTIEDHLEDAGIFSQFLAAARRAGVLDTLENGGDFTVFAPSDEAFAGFEPRALQRIAQDRELLTAILADHVVSGRIYADTLHHRTLETLSGKSIDVDWSRGRAFIGEIEIVATDFEASNGVMHVVDGVLGRD
ncbi:MAG: fasciclin domain-containing protein [Planctomycetota bacterium]|jgi:transforming growth factor-beta-induced protein